MGVTTCKGTASLFLAGVPVHNAVGTGTAVASHALGYEHPATVTIPIAVSPPSNHPSPPSTAVAPAVGAGNDCVGSVGTGPVAVYVGSSATLLTRPMDVGGHGYLETSAGLMEPDAPGPPVWYALYVPSKGASCGTPREAQWPFGEIVREGLVADRWKRHTIESRGSFGIQPLSTPSLYDHKGERGLLSVALGPIFQVQKNQCWKTHVRRKIK